jgi:hypothetical protein
MILSDRTLSSLCERFCWDWASEYGEPGYGTFSNADVRAVILGDYWLRDRDKNTDKLQAFEDRWPRIWQALEESGVCFEWYDEWVVDHERSKAYRYRPDSYTWQPSVVHNEHGDLLTPDDDIEDWIDWAKNEPTRALLRSVHRDADLTAAGFTIWPDDDTYFENGFHPGQDDNPTDITDQIRAIHGDTVDIVFHISGVGQFDIRFTTYIREAQ